MKREPKYDTLPARACAWFANTGPPFVIDALARNPIAGVKPISSPPSTWRGSNGRKPLIPNDPTEASRKPARSAPVWSSIAQPERHAELPAP